MPPVRLESSPTIEALTGTTEPRRAPSVGPATTATPRTWLPIFVGIVIVLIESFHLIVQSDFARVYRDPLVRLAILAVVLAGAGMYAAHRYKLIFPSALLGLATAYAVLIAFAISLVETAMPLDPGRPVLGMSAVGAWILLMCVLLPNPPRVALLAGLAAAAMWPLAYAVNVGRHGWPLPAWDRVIVWPVVNVLMAVLGCLIRRHWSEQAAERQSTSELGGYRLLAPIGRGGMGEVWKASHQMLARKAAIKLVRPAPGSFARQKDVWVERFRREANVIAALQSPNTIYLYDFGVSRDGQFYYVMELLDGISLQTLVATFGPQPTGRVRSMLQQICASLDEAHEGGMVHRDLKPSNVMLCRVALTYDFIKVLDFGLAKCAACEDVGQLTVEGTTAGTPGYIAPEVALGEVGVDARADIYALGCIAYFLLTGTLVFPDSNPMSMALKHVQAQPDPPSTRTELPVPAALEAIVMQCLEKAPANRPASVRAISEMLERCDLPPWTQQDANEWWRRNLPSSSSLRVFWEDDREGLALKA